MAEAFVDLGDKIQIIVKYLKPNIVLNCPTFDGDGNAVLPAYVAFTKDDIDRLLSSGIDKIYYSKPKAVDIVTQQSSLTEYLDKNVYQGPRTIRTETQKKAVNVISQITQKLKDHEAIDYDESKEVIKSISKDINESNEEIVNLLDIQSYDDDVFSHALNVGIISMVFARVLDMDEKLVEDVGLGGFLHDIGKIRVPREILHKEGPLTTEEFGIVKKHPRYGYEMVKKSTQITETVKKIVLLHHEKFDGSGYPFGFKANQIDDSVYIVAIAEIYDVLTTKLSYKEAFGSKEAVKSITNGSGSHFKPDLVHRFANKMGSTLLKESSYYQIGHFVLLNTKEIAKIVSKDSDLTSRPGLEIVKDKNGNALARPLAVDLNLDASRHIVRTLGQSESV